MARWFRHGLSVPSLSSDGASLAISCSVSTSRSSNRTCGFPASGSRTRVDHVQAYLPSHARSAGVFQPFLEVLDSSSLSLAFISVRPSPELRSLPSPGVTRVLRYSEPLRHPIMPGLSLAGFRLGFTHMRGFPCCSHCPLSYMPSPLPRLTGTALRSSHRTTAAFPALMSGRLNIISFRGLLSVHSR